MDWNLSFQFTYKLEEKDKSKGYFEADDYKVYFDFSTREELIMADTSNITIRMDNTLRKQAEELFSDFGLTLSAAYIMFVKQAVREQRIPFEITRNVPNDVTLSAIRETEEMEGNPDVKTFSSVDELMEDLMA